MDAAALAQLIQFIGSIPGIGPYLPTILAVVSLVVTLGSILATFLKAPVPTSSKVYTALYAVVQWCSLAKGQAVSLTSPAVNGLVAGPFALSAPAQVATSVRVADPVPLAPGALPAGVSPLARSVIPVSTVGGTK